MHPQEAICIFLDGRFLNQRCESAGSAAGGTLPSERRRHWRSPGLSSRSGPGRTGDRLSSSLDRVEPPVVEVDHMESAGRNVDQVASMVGKDAPSLDPSVARGGGPGHRVATQPETMTGVDDERWGIEVPGCRRPSDRSRYRGGSGSLAFAPDGRRPMTVPEPPADHHQRGHHHHARQQDEGEVHVRTWLFRADRRGCGTRPVSEDVARPIITCTSGSPVHASMAQRTAGPWSLAPAHKCRSAEVPSSVRGDLPMPDHGAPLHIRDGRDTRAHHCPAAFQISV